MWKNTPSRARRALRSLEKSPLARFSASSFGSINLPEVPALLEIIHFAVPEKPLLITASSSRLSLILGRIAGSRPAYWGGASAPRTCG